jgi:hypothetical protein
MEQKQISISELSIEELQSLVQEKEERKLQLESLLKQGDYKNLKNGEAVRAGVECPYDPVELHAANQAMRDELNEIEVLLPQVETRISELKAQEQMTNDREMEQ